ncbi:hypothetical protein, partial [Streptomyces erythrochromogenes]|uniref:hypothetical protein n=1 Tax=Streptomyces erythrochromogenes TaxID=285574 RepID=UPI003807E761
PPKWTGYQLLALIFGTLLSSQGTDASFVLTLSDIRWGFPPGFRSTVLRFQLYQIISVPCFSKVAVASDLNSVTVGGLCLSASTTLALFPCDA